MKDILNNALAYIGQKLDAILVAIQSKEQNLNIDLGKSSKQLEDAAVSLTQLVSEMRSNENTKAMGQELAALQSIGHQMSALSDTIKKTAPVMDKKETKRTNKLIGQLIKSVDKAYAPEINVDVDMEELKAIATGIDTLNKGITLSLNKNNPQLDRLIELMEKVAAKKFKVPDVIKLEENQLRQLRTVGMSGGSGGGASMLAAMKATMANVAMTVADTEYSYTLPKGTTSFYIKIRSQNTKLLFAWEAGKLPGSGDGTAYMTIPQNGMQSRPGLDLSGKTIYFESAAATQVCEIESYQ